MARAEIVLPDGYAAFLGGLKRRVRDAQGHAQRTINTQLIELYWSLGRAIVAEQEQQGWGAGVIDRLAGDLRVEFPQMSGLSRSNLQYMRALAAAWPANANVPQAVGHLPWGHIRLLLDKLDDQDTREWYATASVKNGWSRNVLLNQIKNRTLERTGAAPSNFSAELAPADSDLARQIAKDPYVFDFLNMTEDAAERDLEQALMDRIVDTLRELGTGFAFVGRQVHFDVAGDDFYLDLLFFHIEQLRYVVIELKTGKFQPEHAGKLSFYVSLVDDRLRRETHTPTVGILICGDRNDHTVRYALSRSGSPMAVSTYTYDSLPPTERNALPDADELTSALGWNEEEPAQHD
ncbi:PDDEXK nuclease domain-containing protein [Cryobacterium aureum]|uniref:PDDEXK nuclease domain-containing protein n=1 Tax=Cryobacterium aureum TaxID=995037 RepID=UPI000CF43F67|nr:PDDEXK nuclease domain-containing protein [Cryobacterium aureum]